MKHIFATNLTPRQEVPLKTKVLLFLAGTAAIALLITFVCFELGIFQDQAADMERLARVPVRNSREVSTDVVKDSFASITGGTKGLDPYVNTVWYPETKRLFDSGHAMMAVESYPEMMVKMNAALTKLDQEDKIKPEKLKMWNPDGTEDTALSDHYYEKAQQTRATVKNVFLSRILQCRGFGHLKKRDYDRGIADITASIECGNDAINKKNYINRAQAYDLIGRHDLAEADMKSSTSYSH